jgi:hypothetical protein
MSSMSHPGGGLKDARKSLAKARQTGFTSQLENGTAQLEAAAASLDRFHRALRENPPDPAARASLRAAVEEFIRELRHTEDVHRHAAAFHAGWTLELARLAGLDPSIGYDRSGAVDPLLPPGRIDCKA